ncbi:c-type cytochrome [Nocardioides sp. ChNu-153]|uniref:cytochrome bc1 complex diheme cytochrome c subunit n=1 Tax=unclassified Nocardioides TaxID=2615069 RepID=UPI0024068FF7|nr:MULTISPECIES: cytochrome c [unclassified Nocardioides]MDF9715935.1 cytochrome c [Nocardioides sp. ChNu-99]MDN7122928.1 c-type cytochrome [Nocardioides sp. ChNu-153]
MRFLNRSAGRLSRHRRGPLAGLVVLLLGLVLTGTAYAAFAPAGQAEEAADNAELVEQGRELFLVGCATCHGQNGEGVLDVNGNQLGPSLQGVGAASVDFQVGTGRMPMVQPGQQNPSKNVAYSDEEIEALAAFVASLGPGPGIPEEEQYSSDYLDSLSAEERDAAINRGQQIFLTNCTACHNFNGRGGAMPRGGYAPGLRETSEKHIYEAMLTGPGQMDVFSDGNIPPENKREVIAFLTTLEEEPQQGGFSLGGLGPVSEGLFAWLLGIGGLVGFAVWIAAHTTRTQKGKGQA